MAHPGGPHLPILAVRAASSLGDMSLKAAGSRGRPARVTHAR